MSTGQVSTGTDRGRPSRMSSLLLLFAGLLLAVAAILLWRSFGESISGTSVTMDSIDSAGPEPRVRLANAAGQVRVEGVKESRSVDYEATRYAMGADPVAAKQRASEVPVDISREDSKIVIETDGGEDTGADYTLRMPTGGSVEVESEVGDVEVSGISGNVTVGAEAGDVRVRDVGGDVEVEAPRGDVSVGNVNTDTGGANLEVGSGDIFLEDLILGTLEASVEAGDVTLSGRFSGGGRVSVETGDIIARLDPQGGVIRPAIFASVVLYLDLLLEAVLQMLWLREFNFGLVYAPFLGLVVAIVLAPLLIAGLVVLVLVILGGGTLSRGGFGSLFRSLGYASGIGFALWIPFVPLLTVPYGAFVATVAVKETLNISPARAAAATLIPLGA